MAKQTPTMECKPRYVGLLLLTVYLLAGFIDPCDGHSCDAEVTHGTR